MFKMNYYIYAVTITCYSNIYIFLQLHNFIDSRAPPLFVQTASWSNIEQTARLVKISNRAESAVGRCCYRNVQRRNYGIAMPSLSDVMLIMILKHASVKGQQTGGVCCWSLLLQKCFCGYTMSLQCQVCMTSRDSIVNIVIKDIFCV